MAKFIYKNAFLSVNAVNLSSNVRSLTLEHAAAEGDKTAMSNNSIARLAGLKDWTLTVEFVQDFASGSVDATLFALVGAAAFAIEVRPDAGAVSPTNPKFTGNAILTSYQPQAGSVGDVALASATLSGDGDLTRATA